MLLLKEPRQIGEVPSNLRICKMSSVSLVVKKPIFERRLVFLILFSFYIEYIPSLHDAHICTARQSYEPKVSFAASVPVPPDGLLFFVGLAG